MATQLDLQEQEQLDQLKAFWNDYGNLITWLLAIALVAFAGWNLWLNHQVKQSAEAAVLFDQVQAAGHAADADHAGLLFDQLKDRYPRTAFAEQAGLVAAKLQYDKGQPDAAKATLGWVAEHAGEDEFKAIARLRLAGILLDQKKYDDALKQLSGEMPKEFSALADDRRGDILMAEGKKDEAKAAYQSAWKGLDDKTEYRVLVDAKLTALGAPPAASAAASGASR